MGILSFFHISHEMFTKDLFSGRGHAYLVSGSLGSDLESFGQWMAACFLCTGETPPCGNCSACKSLSRESNFDLKTIRPIKDSIGILALREQKNFFSMPVSGESKAKVCLILGADTMTREAANSLLKIMEDPFEDLIFILTTARPAALPATILSRCRRFRLLPLPQEEIVSILEGNDINKTSWEPRLVAAVAGNYPGSAREISEDMQWQDSFSKARLFLDAIIQKKGTRWDVSRQMLALDTEQMPQVLLLMAFCLRDIGIASSLENTEKILLQDHKHWVGSLSDKISGSKAWAAARELLSSRFKLQENVNRQLHVESLLIRLYTFSGS